MRNQLASKFSILNSLVATASISLFACSQPAAHVGDAVSQAEVQKGVNVTSTESRYLQDNGKIAGEDTALIEAKATVTSVDKKKRLLTIRSEEGKVETVKAGEEIRNFNQIVAGDKILVQYFLSVAFEVRKPTQEELELSNKELGVAARAPLGKRPGMALASGSLQILTVSSIDKKNGMITVKDSHNTLTSLKAKYPENLSYVNSGDTVVLTVTEALAASIKKLP